MRFIHQGRLRHSAESWMPLIGLSHHRVCWDAVAPNHSPTHGHGSATSVEPWRVIGPIGEPPRKRCRRGTNPQRAKVYGVLNSNLAISPLRLKREQKFGTFAQCERQCTSWDEPTAVSRRGGAVAWDRTFGIEAERTFEFHIPGGCSLVLSLETFGRRCGSFLGPPTNR